MILTLFFIVHITLSGMSLTPHKGTMLLCLIASSLYWQVGLLDSLYDTERGLTASSETRAEINELITQLEAMSPISNPNEVRMSCSVYVGKYIYSGRDPTR